MPSASHSQLAGADKAELVLVLDQPGPVISRNIYGHFAEHLGRCIYEGIWVGEASAIENTRGIRRDVVAALKQLRVPVLRWPGGCFADEYHWRDGIGPRESRPKMINTHWGGGVENNHFGTHEFMDFCEQIGAEPYVCGNVGSGSVQEMMEWVEYMTSDADSPMANLRRQNGREAPWKLPYFGVGNESWGCGGNMRPEYYADNFRRYATFVKNYGQSRVQRIACGANGPDYNWTEVLMASAGRHMHGLSLHWYTLPTDDWQHKGSATDFDEAEWHSTFVQTLRMEELVTRHAAIMDRYDPEKRVGMMIDEWGTWYDVEPGTNPGFLYQQNTLRDALVAAINLNIFNQHCDRVTMANIAQTINVLQAMILTDKARMLLTPSYHAFEMYKVHQGQTSIPLEAKSPEYVFAGRSLPMLHASASRSPAGELQVSLVNLHPSRGLSLVLSPVAGDVHGRLLTAPTLSSRNTFDDPNAVAPVAFTAFSRNADQLTLALPAKSLVVLAISAQRLPGDTSP
jgi:alpha-N-arabinofuranosidase